MQAHDKSQRAPFGLINRKRGGGIVIGNGETQGFDVCAVAGFKHDPGLPGVEHMGQIGKEGLERGHRAKAAIERQRQIRRFGPEVSPVLLQHFARHALTPCAAWGCDLTGAPSSRRV